MELDDESLNFDSESGDLDSDVEEILYSQVHHEWNPNQDATPNRLNSSISFQRLQPCEIVLSNQRKPNNSLKNKISTEVNLNITDTTSEVVIVEDSSDDDCEVIENDSDSKYGYCGRKKRKLLESEDVEVVSIDDVDDCDSRDIYVHVYGNEALPQAIETVDIVSPDYTLKENGTCTTRHPNYVLDDISETMKDLNYLNNKPRLTVQDITDRDHLFKKMKEYYNTSSTDLCNVSSRDVINSLPGVEWFVAASDRKRILFDKSRKSKASRISCLNCNERGHIARYCPSPRKKITCYLCGEHHNVNHCRNRCCAICWQQGHYPDRCRDRKKILKMQCTTCKCYGHSTMYCPDLWRKYHLTTKPGPIVISTNSLKPADKAYCSNCAARGHFVHQCKKQLMDEFTFVHRPDIMSYSGLLSTPINQNATTQAQSSSHNKSKLVSPKKSQLASPKKSQKASPKKGILKRKIAWFSKKKNAMKGETPVNHKKSFFKNVLKRRKNLCSSKRNNISNVT